MNSNGDGGATFYTFRWTKRKHPQVEHISENVGEEDNFLNHFDQKSPSKFFSRKNVQKKKPSKKPHPLLPKGFFLKKNPSTTHPLPTHRSRHTPKKKFLTTSWYDHEKFFCENNLYL